MNPELREALEACRSLLPEGVPRSWRRGGTDAGSLEAFRACMKDNGVDITGENLRDLRERADADLAAALRQCRSLLPVPVPGVGRDHPGPGRHWHDGRRGPGAPPHGPGTPGPGAPGDPTATPGPASDPTATARSASGAVA